VLVVKRAAAGPYRCVLAASDFSPPAAAALALARRLAPGASLHLGHAFELPYDGMMRHAGVDETAAAQYHALARERLMLDLDGWATAEGVAPGARTLHVSHGYAATQVDAWVGDLGIDLVAIGAHGKSEIEATFLGSVSLHTVLAVPCDVLVLRSTPVG
jgi:nucleotide-binding universal stress UspA family protein